MVYPLGFVRVRRARPQRTPLVLSQRAITRSTAAAGGHLELHDPTSPDVPPIALDDFLTAVPRCEIP